MASDAIAQWKAEITELSQAYGDLWSGLTDEQRRWKENAQAWSVAECIDHVRVTNEAYRPNLVRAIETARRRADPSEPYRAGRIARWFHGQIDPARSKRKMPAPGPFRPTAHPSDPMVLVRFLDEQTEVERLMGEASEVSLNRSKLFSPATKLIRLSIGEVFETIVLHERRHLRQARAVPEKSGFPSRN